MFSLFEPALGINATTVTTGGTRDCSNPLHYPHQLHLNQTTHNAVVDPSQPKRTAAIGPPLIISCRRGTGQVLRTTEPGAIAAVEPQGIYVGRNPPHKLIIIFILGAAAVT